jgi:CHAD domain-containing protein
MEQDYIMLRPLKPVFSGYLREAESILGLSSFPDENAVHDVRVLMKKAKAVLRITHPQLNKEFGIKEKKVLREIGRIMSPWRDNAVLRKTLKSLKKENPDIFLRLKSNEKINELMKKPVTSTEVPENLVADLQKIREILRKSGYSIRFEPMNNLNPNLLLKELESAYNKVVSNYIISRNKPKQANLHEFRKRSKDFLYQLWFFRPLNPGAIKTLEKKLDSMTRDLGKYNDLAQLIKDIGYNYRTSENDPALDELILIIRNEQDLFLSKVWPVAHKIFHPGQKLVNVLGYKILLI